MSGAETVDGGSRTSGAGAERPGPEGPERTG
jgi:hypothetical protein